MGVINRENSESIQSPAELGKSIEEIKGYLLTAIHCAGSGHSGGSLSAAEIVGTAFLNIMKHKPADPFGKTGTGSIFLQDIRLLCGMPYLGTVVIFRFAKQHCLGNWTVRSRDIRICQRLRGWNSPAVLWGRASVWLSVMRYQQN